jgi:alpha-mannosidase
MPDTAPTFYIIPHTHWEGAVFQTREAYLEMGLPNILRALALLEAYPDYRFTLDQVCYVKPFLERYPEHEAAFRRFVAEGRLALVGGTDTMLDVNMPGGESWVRQVLYGKRFFGERLGLSTTIGWQLDTFGHHAQMPQLLKLSGLRSFWFFRGVPAWEAPTDFLWEGLDGTRIPAFWLPLSYGISYGSPSTFPEFAASMEARYNDLGRFYHSPLRPGVGGADVCPPEEHLPPLVEEYNRQGDGSLRLVLATPAEYEAARGLGDDAPVFAGELNPIFQGIYSSRIELKQQTRRLEGLLTTAEKLGVLLRAVGVATDDGNLWEAWERMLFNQAHDLMSGVMTDRVYEDTQGGYDFARRIAEAEVATRLNQYRAAIDTTGEGRALVVFNALGMARTDVVFAKVGFAASDAFALRLLDPDGQAVPVQIMREQRYGNGALLEAEIAFIAREVPALGHAVYRLLPAQPDDADVAAPGMPLTSGILENERFRVEVDPLTGAITSLTDAGDEVLSGPGNVVVQEEDRGDFWEPYRPLDGGSRIAMTDEHPLPRRGVGVYSDEWTGEAGRGVAGPVVSEFTVEHPFGERGRFATTVRVYAGLGRIEVRTRILNNDEFVRYRAAFPTTISEGQAVHEIPFGASARPAGIEFPAQNWADWSDGSRGLALLNRGLPGNAVIGGTMLLSLLRCTCIVAYGFGGGYGPGMSSDTGQQLGKELTFDYALAPHAGDWREAGVYRAGQEFNSPLLATTAATHAGTLPARWGYLEVMPVNVIVSALKPADDGAVVLRIYEAAGQATPGVRIRLPEGAHDVAEVDLLEDVVGELSVDGGVLEPNLGAFEIKSVRFVVG